MDYPKNYKARTLAYSSYKKSTTVSLYCPSPSKVNVAEISPAWGGTASDVEIVKKSGSISHRYLEPGDQLLTDMGSTL